MFREIRTSERITEEDERRRKAEERQSELEKIRRIAGRQYSEAEYDEAKQFVYDLFMSYKEESYHGLFFSFSR